MLVCNLLEILIYNIEKMNVQSYANKVFCINK